MSNPDPGLQPHYNRKRRRAMAQMARACDIDPTKFADTPEGNLKLWNTISEAIAEGVKRTADPIVGDPFAVFLTGICQADHDGKGDYRQTAVVKTGTMVDQTEGEKIIAFLKAQDNVNTCEACGERIHVWQADNTRVSTFAARPENRNPAMATTIRGSD